jgi:hypothetical protein
MRSKYVQSLGLGAILFLVSITFNIYASRYAAERVSYPVTDIVLSNTRVYDVDGFIISWALVLLFVAVIYVAMNRQTLPFVIKAGSLFIVIRSIFISLTHLGPFSPSLTVTLSPITSLGLGNAADLFFSGHTGMPFLAALIFWENKYLRYLFLASSMAFGVAVLLGHLHYSIDVLAAFFITYSIYCLAKYLFAEDLEMFKMKV